MTSPTYFKNILIKYGLDSNDSKNWRLKYKALSKPERDNRLSFDDYIFLAVQAGLISPTQIGRHTDDYQLARYGDVGPYKIGNCRFITRKENHQEWVVNGGFDVAHKKCGLTLRGRSKETHQYLKNISEFQKSRNKNNDEGRKSQSIKLKGRNAQTSSSVALRSKNQCKEYIITSPDGKIYKGKGLKDFSKNMGLNKSKMSRMMCGHLLEYKGFTGHYVE